MTELPLYNIITTERLKALARGACPCCGDPFRKDMPPELTGRCHAGPSYVAYWDGWLLLQCGECRKPIGKIKVHD